MAHVFRGKIAIPGDQLEAYVQALGEFEHDKAPLRKQLEQYARDFERTLVHQYAPKTVRKHLAIEGVAKVLIQSHKARPNSSRLMNNPMTKSCM